MPRPCCCIEPSFLTKTIRSVDVGPYAHIHHRIISSFFSKDIWKDFLFGHMFPHDIKVYFGHCYWWLWLGVCDYVSVFVFVCICVRVHPWSITILNILLLVCVMLVQLKFFLNPWNYLVLPFCFLVGCVSSLIGLVIDFIFRLIFSFLKQWPLNNDNVSVLKTLSAVILVNK